MNPITYHSSYKGRTVSLNFIDFRLKFDSIFMFEVLPERKHVDLGRSFHVNQVSRLSPVNIMNYEKYEVSCLTSVARCNTAEQIRQNISLASPSVRWGLRSQRASGCMELANDAFYLFYSAVFQCVEYQ